jgi:hypothetical protein
MKHRFLMSVAVAALIAGTGLVHAQDTGGSPRGGAASGPGDTSTPHPVTGPAPIRSGIETTPVPGSEQSGSRAESGRGPDSGITSGQSDQRPGERNQRAQDQSPGQKSNMRSDSRDNSKSSQDMKAEDRSNRPDNSRAEEQGRDRDGRSTTTTGQAGAGGKLSGDQRNKITTVIKRQRVEPATNINFSISIGTRVPREVRFHPLPAEIVTVYPDWRGYEFFLVRDEIVVVDPRTMEIVAVLDA